MDIDIAKIENLISMYIKLDEDGQEEVCRKVKELWLSKICAANEKQNSGMIASGKNSGVRHQKGPDDALIKKLEDMKEFLDLLHKLDEDGQAAALIGTYKLAGKRNITEPKVKVTITYQSKTLKEMIAELFPQVDYDHAYQLYQENMEKIQTERD